MKRVLLFLATNLAVIVVLGLVASLLGVNRYLTASGLNLGLLLGFAAVIGFGGAFISLLMYKPIDKWSTGAEVIEQPRNATEKWLVDAVGRLAAAAATNRTAAVSRSGTGWPPHGVGSRRWRAAWRLSTRS